jgi:hypothetical protein
MIDGRDLHKIAPCPNARCSRGLDSAYVVGELGMYNVVCDCGWRGPRRCTEMEAIDVWGWRHDGNKVMGDALKRIASMDSSDFGIVVQIARRAISKASRTVQSDT